jgi:hypothetical protein
VSIPKVYKVWLLRHLWWFGNPDEAERLALQMLKERSGIGQAGAAKPKHLRGIT